MLHLPKLSSLDGRVSVFIQSARNGRSDHQTACKVRTAVYGFSKRGDRSAQEFWNRLLQGRVPSRARFHYVVTVERFDKFISWLQMKETPRCYMTDCASNNDERYYVAPSGHLEKVIGNSGTMSKCASVYLLAVFLLSTSTGCKSKSAEAADFHPPPGESWVSKTQLDKANIQIEEVSERDVATTLVTSARLTFHDAHVTHVFTPVTGRVVAIQAQLGQTVKKGDPLVTIQSPDIGLASSDYGKAEADLTAARHDRDRKRALYDMHAGSQAELEVAEDNYGKAKAELDRAKQKAALLRAGTVDTVSQTYVLKSIIDGEVLMRNVNPGIEVQGQYSGGNALELFTIGTLDPIWALADIYEVDLARVHAGATIRLSVVTYPDKVFEGKVDWISEMLDPVTRTARVRCTLGNSERLLKPEMFATASISTSGRKTLAVKRDAVVRLGEQDMVMISGGESANGQLIFKRRPVRVDMTEPGEFVPVLNGLTAGERVVVKNAILLST